MNNLVKDLNYLDKDINHRVDIVKNILNENDELLLDYLDDLNKIVCIKQTDTQISMRKNQKILEKLSNYILQGKSHENDTSKEKIKTYTIEQLNKKAIKQYKTFSQCLNDVMVSEDDNINVVIKNTLNYKYSKDTVINKEDLLMDYIKDYEVMKQSLLKEMNILKIARDSKNNKRLAIIKKLLKEIEMDKKLCKEYLLKPIMFKRIYINTNKNDIADSININKRKEIMALLKCDKKYDTNIGLEVDELNKVIDKIKFNEMEKNILKLYRQGYKYIEIAYKLNLDYYIVKINIKKIIRRIVKKYTITKNSN